MSLTTIAAVQNQLKGTEANKATGTNQQLLNVIRLVTGRVAAFNYRFEPFFYTRKITPTNSVINSSLQTLMLGDTLCECTAITIGGVSYAYGSTILPYPNDGLTPYRQLRIAAPFTTGPNWWPCCAGPDNWFESIQITGFWAMRTEYAARGFWDSGLTTPVLTATQTSFTTQAFNGNDPYYRTPILSAGNLLRVDDELMETVNTNTTNNTDLNVLRGVNGTTAVTHALGTAIKVFEPEEDISNEVTRQAALTYARRGAYGEASAGGVTVTYPPDLLDALRACVQKYNYVPYRGG